MEGIISTVVNYLGNLKRNLWGSFVNMTPEKYIRLIAVLGAYLLLRPYLVKVGEKIQEAQLAKEQGASKAAIPEPKISANALRGQVSVPEDTDEEAEAEADTTGANWGKKARKMQRQIEKRVLEAEEKLRQEQEDESEDDPEIEKFLQDHYGTNTLKEE